MSNHYANLTLIGVAQDELVTYLSSLGCKSFVSPTVNDCTVMYDISFEMATHNLEDALQQAEFLFLASTQWIDPEVKPAHDAYINKQLAKLRKQANQQAGIINLARLDSNSARILEQYGEIPESHLVCWAAHLSQQFSCTALAVYLRGDSQLWYHVSHDGEMVDEYTTYAHDDWIPGQPITSDDGYLIAGGNAQKLCTTLGVDHKTDEVDTILRKPHWSDPPLGFYRSIDQLAYQDLLGLAGFPDGTIRHKALSMSLDIAWQWVVEVDYALIASGTTSDDGDDILVSGLTTMDVVQVKQAGGVNRRSKSEGTWDRAAKAYYKKLLKGKGLSLVDRSLEPLADVVHNMIQALQVGSQPEKIELLLDIETALLHQCPLSKAGRCSELENFLIVLEALSNSTLEKTYGVAPLAFRELDSTMQRGILVSPICREWESRRSILTEWLGEVCEEHGTALLDDEA